MYLATLFAVLLLMSAFVPALILMAIVIRNARVIQRFRWRVRSAPVEAQHIIGRKKDWALGWLAVGAGSICLAWAGIVAFAIPLALSSNRSGELGAFFS